VPLLSISEVLYQDIPKLKEKKYPCSHFGKLVSFPNWKHDREGRIPMLYGGRIRAYRESMGMTQEELAEQTGIVASSISKIEHGTRKVTLEEAVRFAEVLHISLLQLAGIAEGAMPQPIGKELASVCAKEVSEVVTILTSTKSRLETLVSL
jgi:transcriptional regulator with XRE-family HTH domain